MEQEAEYGEHTEALSAVLCRFPEGFPAYIGVGPGWYPLIAELDARLSRMRPDYEVHQVKEKFGGLRYYIGSATEEMRRLVAEAEARSYTVCERTGRPGVLVSRNGWLKTLSPEDFPDWERVPTGT